MSGSQTQDHSTIVKSVQDLVDTVKKLKEQNQELEEENTALVLEKSFVEVNLAVLKKKHHEAKEDLAKCDHFLASLRHSLYFRPEGRAQDWTILAELQALEQSLNQTIKNGGIPKSALRLVPAPKKEVPPIGSGLWEYGDDENEWAEEEESPGGSST